MSLEIFIERKQESFFVVSCVGAIDANTAKNLELKLSSVIDDKTKVVTLNMEGIKYISSMGLSVIFKAKETVERNGGAFMLVNLQPQVKKVFEIVKALPSLNIFESMEEADNYFARIQENELNKDKN